MNEDVPNLTDAELMVELGQPIFMRQAAIEREALRRILQKLSDGRNICLMPSKRVELLASYKGYEIQIFKDAPTDAWYIIVHHPNGEVDYDGWFPDSASLSIDKALAEAIEGAQIDAK